MGRPRKDAFDESTTVRVLRAAEQVFGERGFADARLSDIAESAGIRRSSLLYHFGSKDNLYQRVVDHAFAEISAAMASGMNRGTTYEGKIAATVDELLAFQEAHAGLMAVILRALLNPSTAGHQAIGDKFTALIDQLEQFVRAAGGDAVSNDVPIRAMIMQLIVGRLAHAAMGELGPKLFGGDASTRTIARILLVDTVSSRR